MITLSSADTSDHLVAGRRAAYAELRVRVGDHPDSKWLAREPEAYCGTTSIEINGFNILSALDAAILETIARVSAPLVVRSNETKLRWLRPGVLPL